ncbi:MAG TPA: dienelactone hydrolase family protein [Marmoricola sp.]|nr:dienelactone hydrolase family protein [Marmoricola sp.]
MSPATNSAVTSETIEIPVPDGTAEAYLARPDGGTHPGVLFFMDAIGLRPQIARMVERIAGWGYVVLAPNLFHRVGPAADLAPQGDLREPGEREAFMKQVMPRVRGLSTDTMEQDITAYLRALRGLDGVAPGPVGVTGYCMGARFAVRAAGLDPTVAAVGGWHAGGLVTEDPDSPHTRLKEARAEFVFGHADNDRSMGPEAIERLGEALAEAGLTATNEVYAGAAHGYTMADTSMYDEAAAERHFAELEALFARRL